MVFSCECGQTKVNWLDFSVKRLCPRCGSELKADWSKQISLEAFNMAKESISNNQELVFEVIKKLKSCNNRMIAETLGWTINRVTPRVKELRDMNPPRIVLDTIIKDDTTNINTQFWKIN